jgi:hypothetical protein
VGGTHTSLGEREIARRARARSKTKKIFRLKLLSAALGLALIGVSLGWILTAAKLEMVESEKMVLQADLRRTESLLEKARDRLKQREAELANAIQNRIPGLSVLEFNKLIDLNDKYVLNVIFADSGVGKEAFIEYHITLKNGTPGVVLPDVKIYLFDEFGLQVGITTLKKEDATRDVALAELTPGESRSYNAKIELERDAAPKYYMIYVR